MFERGGLGCCIDARGWTGEISDGVLGVRRGATGLEPLPVAEGGLVDVNSSSGPPEANCGATEYREDEEGGGREGEAVDGSVAGGIAEVGKEMVKGWGGAKGDGEGRWWGVPVDATDRSWTGSGSGDEGSGGGAVEGRGGGDEVGKGGGMGGGVLGRGGGEC